MRRANSNMVCSSGLPWQHITRTCRQQERRILSWNLSIRAACELTRLTGLLMLLFINNTRPLTRSLEDKRHKEETLNSAASPTTTRDHKWSKPSTSQMQEMKLRIVNKKDILATILVSFAPSLRWVSNDYNTFMWWVVFYIQPNLLG